MTLNRPAPPSPPPPKKKTLRKREENLQPPISELQFSKTLALIQNSFLSSLFMKVPVQYHH